MWWGDKEEARAEDEQREGEKKKQKQEQYCEVGELTGM